MAKPALCPLPFTRLYFEHSKLTHLQGRESTFVPSLPSSLHGFPKLVIWNLNLRFPKGSDLGLCGGQQPAAKARGNQGSVPGFHHPCQAQPSGSSIFCTAARHPSVCAHHSLFTRFSRLGPLDRFQYFVVTDSAAVTSPCVCICVLLKAYACSG